VDKVEGLTVIEGGHLGEDCEPCALSKHHRRPFEEVDRRSENPLELVYSDVCGKFHIKALGGGLYFVTFTDDCTRMCRVYVLRNKRSETLAEAFEQYKAWAERQTGRKIKAIRTDGGGEYHKWMEANLKDSGIEHQSTAPYTPESNGVSERMNRTLMEMVEAMLVRAKAPLKLWDEAVKTACYIRNRLSTSSLEGNITPYEAWTGRTPSVAHIRKFGCLVYRHIPKKIRRKLDHKAMKGILVGYESESGMYRVYHPQNDTVAVSRDLLIFEDKINATARHPLPDFRGVFDDVDDNDVASTETRPVYNEIEVLPLSKVTAPAIPATRSSASPVLPPATSPSVSPPPSPTSTLSPASSPVGDPPTLPIQIPAAQPVRPAPIERGHKLRDLPRVSYKGMVARAFSAVTEPRSYREAKRSKNWKKWEKAMIAELASIEKNDCWELVPPPKGAKIVDSRWVCREKDDDLFKARFVAKGFTQRWGEDYDETYAPVAKYTSIRTLIAMTAGRRFKGRKIHQMDVKTAFLNSKLKERIYIRQPEGFEVEGKEDWVYLLKRALYGLKQSSREWYRTITAILAEFGFVRCKSDHSIFMLTRDGFTTYLALYVDDLLIISENDDHLAEVKRRLAEKFEMKDLGVAKKFLGMEIEYGDDGSITIHQDRYIQSLLRRHGMEDCNPVSTPLDTSTKLVKTTDAEAIADPKEYQSIIGGLMFAAIVTRPDIMCAVGQLSQFNSNPSSKHLAAAKRVLRYLKGTSKLGITYSPPITRLTGYSDADWAGDVNTRRSTTGYVVMLNNGAIAWRSKRQITVALSTMEAEYMAMAEAVKELKWMRQFLTELGYGDHKSATVLKCDNQGAIALAKNPVSHSRAKHIDLRHHFIRDAIEDGIIGLEYIPTAEMTADSLTKALARQKHVNCLRRMGMVI